MKIKTNELKLVLDNLLLDIKDSNMTVTIKAYSNYVIVKNKLTCLGYDISLCYASLQITKFYIDSEAHKTKTEYYHFTPSQYIIALKWLNSSFWEV